MKKINLREYYPDYYISDYFVEVPEQLVQELFQFQRDEAAYRLRTYRHKAYFSLDRNDGIENDILFAAATPDELYEKKLTNQQLYAAINSLPEKQAKRIYAYYFMDMDEPTIAKAERVSQPAVHSSIQRGLWQYAKKETSTKCHTGVRDTNLRFTNPLPRCRRQNSVIIKLRLKRSWAFFSHRN